MAEMYAVAGMRIYIGGAMAPSENLTAASFTGQNWTEIDGWSQTGTLGDTFSTITQTLINRSRDISIKGTRAAQANENTFVWLPNDLGQQRVIAAAEDKCNDYAFKIEIGGQCVPSSEVTISNASPGVVTWAGHGFSIGDRVEFTTTGTLPAPLTTGTVYYVQSVTANSFTLSATLGGAAIATTTAGSGTHTAQGVEDRHERLFVAAVMSAAEQGGGANDALTLAVSLARNSNLVRVSA